MRQNKLVDDGSENSKKHNISISSSSNSITALVYGSHPARGGIWHCRLSSMSWAFVFHECVKNPNLYAAPATTKRSMKDEAVPPRKTTNNNDNNTVRS